MRLGLVSGATLASMLMGATAGALDLHAPHVIDTTSTQAVCEPVSFNVYFERDSARLSEPAEHMLDIVGGHVRGCTVAAVSIEAPAADVVSDEGRRVAGLRGAAVLSALRARGVEAQAVIVTQNADLNEDAPAPAHIRVSVQAGERGVTVASRADGDAA